MLGEYAIGLGAERQSSFNGRLRRPCLVRGQ